MQGDIGTLAGVQFYLAESFEFFVRTGNGALHVADVCLYHFRPFSGAGVGDGHRDRDLSTGCECVGGDGGFAGGEGGVAETVTEREVDARGFEVVGVTVADVQPFGVVYVAILAGIYRRVV